MKRGSVLCFMVLLWTGAANAASFLHNDYSYLQEITFELYTDEVPAYKVPEQTKSIEEMLMFEILHATWKDKHWVAYTLNKNLLGTFKVGQPALLDNDATKKLYFVAAFPGSVGGLDIYYSEYSDGSWSKPKNLGKSVNTAKNESNPGLLNDHTLTYSSGGIIKKLDLNTFKVVDLEEAPDAMKPAETVQYNVVNRQDDAVKEKDVAAAIGDNSTAAPVNAPPAPADNNYGSAIGDNSTAMPEGNAAGSSMKQQQKAELTEVKKQKAAETVPAPQLNTAPAANVSNGAVVSLGNKSREEMLKKYQTAIQIGAFSAPKWEVLNQFARYGKLITYKNENNINVVWLTGFENHAAAESVLQQIKATPGFENAYVTGK